MEEREAADYHLPTTVSGPGEEDYEGLSADDGAFNSQLGWTYVDYMKAAGLDPGERECMCCCNFYTVSQKVPLCHLL